MSRGSSWGIKICLRNHTIVHLVCDSERILFGPPANLFDKIVKTAFYVSRETFCRKNLIQQFHVLRELIRDFWQDTRITLNFFQNCLSKWRESLTEFLSVFFSFSAGFPNWTLALRRNFSNKNTFHWKNFFIYCFRTLTELNLCVQGNVFLGNTIFGVFLQHFGTLSQMFSNLVRFLWVFFFKTALYVTTTTFKRMFFSGKTTQLFNILEFCANMFGCFIMFFQQNYKTAFYLSKWTLGVKNFFEKESFSFFFLDSA